MQGFKQLTSAMIMAWIGVSVAHATSTDVCGGPSQILALVNRPTISDSPCAVPNRQGMVELGYQRLALPANGWAQNFPETEFRFGLPMASEWFVLMPNHVQQNSYPSSGLTATSVGLKHQLRTTKTWVLSLDGLLTTPSGSEAYGSQGLGGVINLIGNRSLNPFVSITAQLGLSSQTEPAQRGGGRFSSFNPDVFLTWVLTDALQTYAELYGQTKTSTTQGWGWNAAAGLIIMPKSNMTLDVEFSQRFYGNLGGFNHYFGLGGSVLF